MNEDLPLLSTNPLLNESYLVRDFEPSWLKHSFINKYPIDGLTDNSAPILSPCPTAPLPSYNKKTPKSPGQLNWMHFHMQKNLFPFRAEIAFFASRYQWKGTCRLVRSFPTAAWAHQEADVNRGTGCNNNTMMNNRQREGGSVDDIIHHNRITMQWEQWVYGFFRLWFNGEALQDNTENYVPTPN